MNKSPIISVQVAGSGKDWSNLVESMVYEDCVEVDDIVKFSMRSVDPKILDDPDMVAGTELYFQYGYIGIAFSPRRICQITKIDTSYGGTVSISITATDKGLALKKINRTRIWKNVTSSEIAQQIATYHGLGADIETTTRKHVSFPQGNLNDFELLKKLASMEENGSFRTFVKDNVLHFTTLDLSKASVRTFHYGGEFANILSFKPTQNENTKGPEASKVTAVTVDPLTKKTVSSTTDSSNTKEETKLGGYAVDYNYNASGRQTTITSRKTGIAPPPPDPGDNVGRTIITPPAGGEVLSNTTNKIKKDASLKGLTATLEIEGDPQIKADEIITISGVAAMHSGNWHISKAVHRIGSNGYLLSLELSKNATGKRTGTPVPEGSEQNKTVGATKGPGGSNTKKVYTYNTKGEQLT